MNGMEETKAKTNVVEDSRKKVEEEKIQRIRRGEVDGNEYRSRGIKRQGREKGREDYETERQSELS